MEEMFLLGDQVVGDAGFIQCHHIVCKLCAVGEQLAPVVIGLPVVINENGRVNAAHRQLFKVCKRSLRTIRNRHALCVIRHAEIQVIFSIPLQAVRRKKQAGLRSVVRIFKSRLVIRIVCQHLPDEGRRMGPVNARIVRIIRVVAPGNILPVHGFLINGPGLHVRRGSHMILFTAVHVLPRIIAAIHIQAAVRHDMRFTVRDMHIQRKNGISLILNCSGKTFVARGHISAHRDPPCICLSLSHTSEFRDYPSLLHSFMVSPESPGFPPGPPHRKPPRRYPCVPPHGSCHAASHNCT